MKTWNFFLPILVVLLQCSRASAISVEEFKKMDLEEQDRAIAGAPPGQKEELIKVRRHLDLLQHFGTEAAVKAKRESTASMIRGVFPIEVVFSEQSDLWQLYRYMAAAEASGKNGISSHDHEKKILAIENKLQTLNDRRLAIHSLVFNLAASPKALELAKKARNSVNGWLEETHTNGTDQQPPSVSAEQLVKVDEEADQILAELKTLPSLSAAEVQKEYEATTEDKLLDR